jgi:hypothetical protein
VIFVVEVFQVEVIGEGSDGNWRPCTDADNIMPYICSYGCAAMKKKQIIEAAS